MEKIKEIGPMKLGILIVAGILLLLISCGDLWKSKTSTTVEKQETEQTGTIQTDEQYRIKMQDQIVEMLRQVQGIGDVKVMITLSASKEKVTLKDNQINAEKSQEETVLVEDGNRSSSPYVLQEKEPVPEGVLVVCEGGADPTVSREIIGAIQVLFNVEAHKIKVMKMQK